MAGEEECQGAWARGSGKGGSRQQLAGPPAPGESQAAVPAGTERAQSAPGKLGHTSKLCIPVSRALQFCSVQSVQSSCMTHLFKSQNSSVMVLMVVVVLMVNVDRMCENESKCVCVSVHAYVCVCVLCVCVVCKTMNSSAILVYLVTLWLCLQSGVLQQHFCGQLHCKFLFEYFKLARASVCTWHCEHALLCVHFCMHCVPFLLFIHSFVHLCFLLQLLSVLSQWAASVCWVTVHMNY